MGSLFLAEMGLTLSQRDTKTTAENTLIVSLLALDFIFPANNLMISKHLLFFLTRKPPTCVIWSRNANAFDWEVM